MLAWKAWEFPHENHGILLRLHAPWFSRESMEFSPCFFHGFSMVFPCFQYQGWTKNLLSNAPWDFHVSVNFRSMFIGYNISRFNCTFKNSLNGIASCNGQNDIYNKLYKKYTKLIKHNLELIALIKNIKLF